MSELYAEAGKLGYLAVSYTHLCERSPGTEVVLLRRRKKFCNGDSPDSLLTRPPCCRCRHGRLRSREMGIALVLLDLAEEVVAWTRRNCSVEPTETVA